MTNLDRRRFNALLAGLGLASAGSGFAAAIRPETLQLSRNGWMPNNEHLPVLLYRNAVPVTGTDPAPHFENLF